ncbi:MAG: dehydrogenase [Planctomycetota bacterium]|nr:MAG: dehydrogenase [Planctomycetota bacterium]
MTKSFHVALLGSKFMGKAHANAWTQAPKFFELPLHPKLAAVAARDAKSLASFAKRWQIPQQSCDWKQLCADESIHLVDIATPNALHPEQAWAALEHGKHLACEKPLAGDLNSARSMRDAAAARPEQKSFVWFNYRRCPAIGLAYQLLRAGRLGKVLQIRARYLQDWGGPETERSWRFEKKHAGSGALGDLAAHAVDLARFLTGDEVSEVSGSILHTEYEQRPDPAKPGSTALSDVDDVALFLAKFEGGAVASFEATRLAAGYQNANQIEIHGSKGSLRWDFEDMNLLWHYDGEAPAAEAGWRRIIATKAQAHPYVQNWWPDAHLLGYEHGFVNMAADICRVLAGEPEELPLPDFADAYETQRVLEAAAHAASERCAIPLRQIH